MQRTVNKGGVPAPRGDDPRHRSADANDAVLDALNAGLAGYGHRYDEADTAAEPPVGRREARRLARKAQAHASDPNAFEPNEAAVQAEIRRQRRTH